MTTPSDTDARIRAAVSELVGAAPPAPVFPDPEARLGANHLATVAARRHRVGVVLVAAALIAVFFAPLPHMSLFNRLATSPSGTVPIQGAGCVGTVVPASTLSSITFFNQTDGLGVSPLSTVHCGARLARTKDGGRTWKLVGNKVPGPAVGFSEGATTMVFVTTRVGWVLDAGVLLATRDGGATWNRVGLGGWVESISRSGSSLWAFVAPCLANPRSCRYRLEATTIDERSWRTVGLLPAALGNWSPLVVTRLSAKRALVSVAQMGDLPVFSTTDGGKRWSSVRACVPSGFAAVSFAATGPNSVWAMCLGGGGMGSSLKSLVRSKDGGKTWTNIAVDRNFDPGTPLPIPAEDGEIIAVASPGTIWMATVNSLVGSFDGGRTWFTPRTADLDGGGLDASFSFVSSTDGWLLAPGSGLWRTTDGKSWHVVIQAPVKSAVSTCAETVLGWELSAITFFNAVDGLGVWSRNTGCGDRLVATRDGGAFWRLLGGELPAPGSSYSTMIFPTPRVGWVLGSGALYLTRDGGTTWSRVPLHGSVAAVSRSGTSLWATVTTCPPEQGSCRYRLEASTTTAASWTQVGLLPTGSDGAGGTLARLTPEDAVVVDGEGQPEVSFTVDGGAHWTGVHVCGPLEPNPSNLLAAGARTVFLTCSGARVNMAGARLQALFRSDDGGKSWQVVAVDRGVDLTPSQDPIPTAAVEVLAREPGGLIWMATLNYLAGSSNGGRTWFQLPGFDLVGGGNNADFSFVGASDGWVLVPLIGLWRTTNDARTWQGLSLWQSHPSAQSQVVPAPGSKCTSTPVKVDEGTVIPGPYLSTIQFLNTNTGVGITASMINCSAGEGGLSTEQFPVWEVVSTDGGQLWRAAGSALPKVLVSGYANAAMAYSSISRGWVEAAGALAYTSDGGKHWRLVHLGGAVTVLQPDGHDVAALVGLSSTNSRTAVWVLSATGAVIGETKNIEGRLAGVQMAVVPGKGELVVVVPDGKLDKLVASTGAGSSWSSLAQPCPKWFIGWIFAMAGDTLGAVCTMGAEMNHEPKIFAVSRDGGRSWTVRSAWRVVQAPDPSGLLTSDLFSAAASPGGEIYMATTMGAALSRDGGRKWTPIEVTGRASLLPGNGSAGGEFSFVGQNAGWLLLQSEGLLRTVDGVHWNIVSSIPSY